MNWIILIIAGLFEVGFTFCLGKIKGATGTDFYLWGAGFVISVTLSMFLLAKAAQTLPIGTAYPVYNLVYIHIALNHYSAKIQKVILGKEELMILLHRRFLSNVK